MTRIRNLTVTLDCFDERELLHRHNHTCMRYRLDEPHDFDPNELAQIAWALDIDRPGRYEVTLHGSNLFIHSQNNPIPHQPDSYEPEPQCEISWLAVSTCAHCRGDISPQERAQTMTEQRLKSRYAPKTATEPGTCSRCRYPYGPGALIKRDTLGGWIYQCCWDLR